jgi:hypothetical protein
LGDFETRERQRFLQKSQIRGEKLVTEDFMAKLAKEISAILKVDEHLWECFSL